MRRLLVSTGWMGGASLVNSLAAAVRAKAFALLLGPAGFGLYGLLQSLQGFLVALADLGLGGAAGREIALHRDQPARVAATLRLACRTTLLLGAAAAALVVLLRRPLSAFLFADPGRASDLAVLAIGLVAAALAGVLFGLLVGLGRVRRNALTRIAGGVLGTVAAILVVWRWGEAGVAWAIVLGPVLLLAAVWLSTRGLTTSRPGPAPLTAALPLLQMGAVIILSPLLRSTRETLSRAFLQHELDLVAVAEFHAASTLSMLCVSFLLASLYPDFYPRVARAWSSPEETRRLVEAQTRWTLLLAAAPILLVQSFPGLFTRLFYSAEFTLAPEILRWHLCGNFLRVVGWTASTALFSGRRLRSVVLNEAVRNLAHLAVLVLLVRRFGLAAAGPAFVVSYLLTLPLAVGLLRRHCGRRLLGLRRTPLVPLLTASLTIAAIDTWLPGWFWLARALAAATAGWALARVVRREPGPDRSD